MRKEPRPSPHNSNPAAPAFPPTSPPCRDYLWEQDWTGGLPVAPPEEDAVRGMVAAVGGGPPHSLGMIQPRNSRATLEKLAINAVMAGWGVPLMSTEAIEGAPPP